MFVYFMIKLIFSLYQLKCCGIYGRDSWDKHEEYLLKTYNSTLPNSCCETQVPCLRGDLYVAQSYTDQCFKKLEIYFEENAELVIWALSGLAVVKVFGNIKQL